MKKRFGLGVALSGNTALIGAPNDASGSAYVFVREGSVWTEQAKLVANERLSGDFFGATVDLDEDTAVIRAFDHSQRPGGTALVFMREFDVWQQTQELSGNDAGRGDDVESPAYPNQWVIEASDKEGYVFIKNTVDTQNSYIRQYFRRSMVLAVPLDTSSWGFYWEIEENGEFSHLKNRLTGQYLRVNKDRPYIFGADLTSSWGFDWIIE